MQHVRAAGGVCIADEVQTGFGRTGTKFWGFENQGVIPDIVTMAKGIGNGLPLAAVVTTEEVAQTMSRRLHFNTFGGNPVCSAGGRAVLKAIEEDGLQANSLKVGISDNTIGSFALLFQIACLVMLTAQAFAHWALKAYGAADETYSNTTLLCACVQVPCC